MNDTFDPKRRVSSDLPSTTKTGREMAEEGYFQLSNKYRSLAVPSSMPLVDMVRAIMENADPIQRSHIEFYIRHNYHQYAAPRVGLTDGQFMEYKEAQREGAGRKWWNAEVRRVTRESAKASLSTAQDTGAKPADGMSFKQIKNACRNIGYDLTCTYCATAFYTGIGLPGGTHDPTCTTKE